MENFTTKQWITFLEVFVEYNPGLGFTKDVLDKLLSGQLSTVSSRQEEIILRLHNKSYQKNKVEAKLKEIKEQNEYTKEMNKKFKETYTQEEPKSSKSSLIEEIERRVPIGFRVPSNEKSTLTNFNNRYKPTLNVKQSSPKHWDDNTWDNFWND